MRVDLKQKFSRVKLLVLDVDGVLTDGRIVYSSRGEELKFFNVQDGLGVYLLKLMGIPTVIVSAKSSPTIKKRAEDMGVEDIYEDVYPKTKVYEEIKRKYKLQDSQVCFVGDDLVDLGVLKRVGVPVAVRNAAPEVKRVSFYTTSTPGGFGAVREVAELILKSQNKWREALNLYYSL